MAFTVGLAVLLITCICLCLIPKRAKLDLQFHAVKITEDGEVMGQGEIVVQGWEINYLFKKDSYRLTRVQFLSDVYSTEGDYTFSSLKNTLPYDTYFGHIYHEYDNRYHSITLYHHPEKEWTVVQIDKGNGDTAYVIGSNNEDFDYYAIFDTWKDLRS